MNTLILCRPQSIACCRLNSAAVGSYIMAFPSLLNDTYSHRYALQDFVKAWNTIKTILITANFNLEEPLNELQEGMDWPTEAKINQIYQLMLANEDLMMNVKRAAEGSNSRVSSQLQKNIADKKPDLLGLLKTFAAMKREEQDNTHYGIIEATIESCETTQSQVALTNPGAITGEGMDLEIANKLFLNLNDPRSKIAPANSRLQLEQYFDYLTSDSAKKNNALACQNLLIEPQNDCMIQATIQIPSETGAVTGHSVSIGKTNGKYWKFDALGHVESDEENKYATLTVFEDEKELQQHILTLSVLEFAKIDYQLKPEQEILGGVKLQPTAPSSASSSSSVQIDNKDDRREQEKAARATKLIADLKSNLQEHINDFDRLKRSQFAERFEKCQDCYYLFISLAEGVTQIDIPDNNPNLSKEYEKLFQELSDQQEKEQKILLELTDADKIVTKINVELKFNPAVFNSNPSEYINKIQSSSKELQQSLDAFNPGSLKDEVIRFRKEKLHDTLILPLVREMRKLEMSSSERMKHYGNIIQVVQTYDSKSLLIDTLNEEIQEMRKGMSPK